MISINHQQQRVYLSKLTALLGWDRRTLNSWIYRKGITTHSDTPGGRKYISSVQFDYAWNESVIQDLQNKYGDHWFEAFKAYQNVDVMTLIAIDQARSNKRMSSSGFRQTENEKQILSRLTGKSFEL